MCLSIPNGPGTILEKKISLLPPLAPTVRGVCCPLATRSDHWYRSLGVLWGDFEALEPQIVGGCGCTRCPRNLVSGAPSHEAPSQSCEFLCPKTSLFVPKRPQNAVKTTKCRETVATLHMRHDNTVTKSPFLPSKPTICPTKAPKMAKNDPNCAQVMANGAKNEERAVSSAIRLQTQLRGHIVHSQPLIFCGFQASELPK